jgi:hypothetical protein
MKKPFVFASFLFLGLFLPVLCARAEEGAEEPDLGKLLDRVAALEKASPVKIGVLLQAQYLHNNVSALTGIYDQFLPKRTEIKLYGDLLPKKISYAVVFDPAQPAAKQLKDYYARLTTIPFADIQFGQGKYPQGLEGRTPSGDLNFVNRALVSSAFGDKRDFFLQVSGNDHDSGVLKAEYAVALVQGSGQNTAENNADKDLAGRAGWTWDDLFFGVTGYAGWEPTGVRNDFGFEARWAWRDVKLQGEYLQGQLEPGNSANPIPAAQKAFSKPSGYYFSAQYRFEDYRLGARWESYNPDQGAGSAFNTANDVLTLGADWFQAQDKFRLYLNFEEHFRQYESFLAQVEVTL